MGSQCGLRRVAVRLALVCLALASALAVEARVSGVWDSRIERWSSALKGKLSELSGPCQDPALCPEAFSIHFAPDAKHLPAGIVVTATDPNTVPKKDYTSIDDIVRIGKEIWDVVEENKGVINYEADYTGAIPKAAAANPFSMTGWVNQDFKGWTWQLVNGYNSTVRGLVCLSTEGEIH
mmetsp:Transcript_20124/g.55848  ORF Transcript_20124/g.55848 Transcript_20124/m.55848 type:complete len:179 (-) Transcript_20124:452-988(-)